VLLDIARALEHLHSLNIMHCDVKSSNIFLQHSSGGKGFVCKLADFGLAKLIGEDRMYLTNHSVSGTITNLAPERMLVRAVWSWQCMLAEDCCVMSQMLKTAA
jgi:serine/threonine protein kinase